MWIRTRTGQDRTSAPQSEARESNQCQSTADLSSVILEVSGCRSAHFLAVELTGIEDGGLQSDLR